MNWAKKAAIGGAMAAGAIVAIFGYLFFVGASFDYGKAVVTSAEDQEFLTDQTIRKSIDAAISDQTTKLFLVRFDNPELKAKLSYLTPGEVELLKRYAGEDGITDLAFLRNGTSAIEVFFDSDTGGSVPEYPMLTVYLEPDSYRVLGTQKAFW